MSCFHHELLGRLKVMFVVSGIVHNSYTSLGKLGGLGVIIPDVADVLLVPLC
jgi:hypothetical protein